MKHSTAVMVTALAWGFAAPARAQQAPPPATPPPPAAQPATPPATPTPPGPAAPAPAPAAPSNPPSAPLPPVPTTPSQAPVPAQPTTAAAEPVPAVAAAVAAPEAQRVRRKRAKKGAEVKVKRPLLGLAVATPDTGALPGRFRPSYGVPSKSTGDYKFDFHGFMNVPLRVGLNERKDPLSTQYQTVFHGPPVVPDELERFEHTGVIPEPWVQLGFSYGNSAAVANIIIAARSVSNASGFFNPPTQLGINDAFITFKPDFGKGTSVEIDVGAFANRYGSMGEYDTGRYDTPVIARVAGVGETLRINVELPSELAFLAEHGVMGQWDRPPLGVEPAGWNGFADPNVGTSFAHHAHLGLAYARRGQVGVHYVSAFTRDDRTATTQPDGSLTVLGLDATGQLPPVGRLYLGVSHAMAEDARGVSGVVRVLNTFGGPGLMREYLGPNSGGTGTLTTFGAQYDVSIGEFVRSPQPYSGYGPDILASVFTMFTHVTSDDAAYDGVDKIKYGLEVTYSALPWLAASARYDRVVGDIANDAKTFAVISPRVILRTDYNSQDQVTLQYSRWFYGSGVVARTGYQELDDPSVEPDADTFTLAASMWW